ncbi:hypothetical protein [Paucibacter sp. XJ19-41]|uniref:hypothetical protein n=1 Tax=Paucibacter sp. XJ19-41 TaxID=2927824 RepID=UPI00234B64B6|nr:hypothetical protein [Paucibacter sp. XJ19-41]MDC6171320.1 hypothetical protein [Paucibacter sp. XJ19-41]
MRSVGAADDAGQRLQVCTKFDTLSRPIEVWAGSTTDTTRSSCDFADALLKRQQTQAWDDAARCPVQGRVQATRARACCTSATH